MDLRVVSLKNIGSKFLMNVCKSLLHQDTLRVAFASFFNFQGWDQLPGSCTRLTTSGLS